MRTLVLASRKLDPQEFKVWSEKYEVARADQNDKKAKMEALQDEIERNLVIVGATAIEDKLQDEVPQTIAQLKQAGIRVWVLTGDKVETAKTIGFSCNLLQQEMSIHEILHKDPEIIKRNLDEALTQIQTDLASFKTHKRGIVVAGEALTTIMGPDRKELALKVVQA